MLLILDIGNTNVTAGIYDNSKILTMFRCLSDTKLSMSYYADFLQTIADNYSIQECAIGSVVNELNDVICRACYNIFNIKPVVINAGSKLNIKINYEHPFELGIDRIANASSAVLKYKLPAIVVDIGTAITFEVISENKEFVGGVIMPGLNLQLKALNIKTSNLPEIKVSDSEHVIGNSTQSCILSGVVKGTASAIEGLIKQCEIELGKKATIIATGGYSSFISNYTQRKFDHIDNTLTLDGLKELYALNIKNQLDDTKKSQSVFYSS